MSNDRPFFKNKKYGRLTTIKQIFRKHGQRKIKYWRCRCSCGAIKTARASSIRYGATTSCGCILKEILTARAIHGHANKSSEYRAWKLMKNRCLPGHKKGYFERGIYVCERWINSYINFYKDMGNKPSKKHSIDRIDNDGPYSPDNCRWADDFTQANNKTNTVMVEFNGEKITLSNACRKYGLSYKPAYQRIRKGKPLMENKK